MKSLISKYGLDEDYLCKPGQSDESRIMWFTCQDFNFGIQLRNELLEELFNIKSFIYPEMI
jgi:hypothetical protein